MAPSSKQAASTKDRRKSSSTAAALSNNSTTGAGGTAASGRILLTLKVAPSKLRNVLDPNSAKAESCPDTKPKDDSPSTSTTLPAPTTNGDHVNNSSPNTPAIGTPAPSSVPMGPPKDGPKKKGTKRGANAMNGEPKVRGKPGPKKKMRLEDGTIEGGTGRTGLGAHKLGPKANMGAINAGLRALDRTGKPCRRWTKAGFSLRSFTGTVWEVRRWSAPPKKSAPTAAPETGASSVMEGGSSGKENNIADINKENNGSQPKSENSNVGADVEMTSVGSAGASGSPARVAVTAA